MNKQGFTLIEILAVITIMGVIATFASVNFINYYKDIEESNTKNANSIIETAACIYIELEKNSKLKEQCLNYGCTIPSSTLIKEGLILENDVDNEKVINIYKENSEKKCVIKE